MSVSQTDFTRLTNLIFKAEVDPRKWQDFLDALHQLTGGVRTHMFGQDVRSNTQFGIKSSGYDPEAVRSYAEYYGTMNAWVPVFMKRAAGSVMHAEEMCPVEDLARTEFYNDWVRPNGDILGGGGAVVFNDRRRNFLLGGNIRRRDIEAKQDQWMALVARLVPSIQHAIEINQMIAAKVVEQTAVKVGLWHPPSVVAIDGQRRVRFANEEAQTLIHEGAVFCCDLRERLFFRSPRLTRLLERLADRLARHELTLETTFRAVDRRNGQEFRCRTARLALRDDATMFSDLGLIGRPLLMLCMMRDQHATDAKGMLVELFSLTPCEAEVAESIAEGRSTREIAEFRKVSIHTIRNQLKSAMSKMDVVRRTELVRKVLTSI
ncbi:helix-turn-helix transcriptional regulator [Aliiroseovarius zhejiangensis]|uniref:helix-turn-helix transcriptional regulator n=1 Tax=Aliiroseovarius zhejiangensis TaxID=1632025 RepID=UPI00174CDAD9|nr:helix-turn-helix transcriptional regulator [Aliiroseovarius zhejiangensis]